MREGSEEVPESEQSSRGHHQNLSLGPTPNTR